CRLRGAISAEMASLSSTDFDTTQEKKALQGREKEHTGPPTVCHRSSVCCCTDTERSGEARGEARRTHGPREPTRTDGDILLENSTRKLMRLGRGVSNSAS